MQSSGSDCFTNLNQIDSLIQKKFRGTKVIKTTLNPDICNLFKDDVPKDLL